MKVKKHFEKQTFRRKSFTVKIFCSNTHLKFFLIFYKYIRMRLSLYK